jgi:hypothetical protein
MEADSLARLDNDLQQKLRALEPSRRKRVLSKLVTAALGSIPWIGGFLVAAQAYKEEDGQIQTDNLQRQWLEEHKVRLQALARDLAEIVNRLDSLGNELHDRIESEEYLALVRKAFRSWDQADTDQKREYVKRLIANAGASTLCPDDLVRLFLDWLDRYHEAHFMVIREIYKNPGATRHGIWANVRGEFPRDNSSEADLFRMLIGDLSTGRVIRQVRDTNLQGQFLTKKRGRSSHPGVLKSAFDNIEPYELTELGREFVHYVFQDVVTRIDDTKQGTAAGAN